MQCDKVVQGLLADEALTLEVVEHHLGCVWCKRNAQMHVVIAFVCMAPNVRSYMVHLFVYALAGVHACSHSVVRVPVYTACIVPWI